LEQRLLDVVRHNWHWLVFRSRILVPGPAGAPTGACVNEPLLKVGGDEPQRAVVTAEPH
jgi:hypothetical protein